MAMLRTRRLTFGRLAALQKPGPDSNPRITDTPIYVVPAGRRAIVREISLHVNGGTSGEWVVLYVSTGTASVNILRHTFTVIPAELVEVRDLVMEPQNVLSIAGTVPSVDYYISGAELLL